jgi:hypothetical protein
MNPQDFWQVAPRLATTFTLSALVACSNTSTTTSTTTPTTTGTNSGNSTQKTEFLCVEDTNQGWVTMAKRNNLISIKPLLIWQTTEFGDNWTPEKRCNHVAEKLNKAVGKNGGYLSNLALTYGPVGNYTVVCVASSPDTCTADNMLFTLKQENAQKPEDVLAKIAGFSQNEGSDNTMLELAGSSRQYIVLEGLLDGAFPSGETRL